MYQADGECAVNQKAENSRERLLNVSIRQFLKKGYSGATTMEIARLAGVSKGALYWHFKSTEDILNAILDRYCDEFITESMNKKLHDCGGDFPTKFRLFYKFSTEFSRENKELLLVFTTMLTEFADTGGDMERRLKDINEQYILIIQRLIEAGKEDGTVGREIDPVIYARFVGGSMMGSHLQWHLHADDDSFSRRLAILQREALLKIVLSRDLYRPGEHAKAVTCTDRSKKR
jgi:AcrR family transcriptional regulator